MISLRFVGKLEWVVFGALPNGELRVNGSVQSELNDAVILEWMRGRSSEGGENLELRKKPGHIRVTGGGGAS